jgi:hypothetical protein
MSKAAKYLFLRVIRFLSAARAASRLLAKASAAEQTLWWFSYMGRIFMILQNPKTVVAFMHCNVHHVPGSHFYKVVCYGGKAEEEAGKETQDRPRHKQGREEGCQATEERLWGQWYWKATRSRGKSRHGKSRQA